MKKVTKVAAVVLAMAMAVSTLTACGGSADNAAEAVNTEDVAADESGAEDANTDVTEDTTEDAGANAEEGDPYTEVDATIIDTVTKTEGVLTFGTNAEFPPFEFVAASGVIDQYDGIDMAIAKQIAEENNMTPAVENMEFDSCW